MLKLLNYLKFTKIIQWNIKKYSSIIKMPSLSPTMESGGIVEWHKHEGDEVSAGDLLCEVQTDKAVVGMEAEDDGILAKILKPKDSKNINVGDPIGIMADRSEDWHSVAAKDISQTTATSPKSEETKSKPIASSDEPIGQEKVGPAARLLLHSYGIQPAQVTHTGPHNTLLKSDVVQHIGHEKLQPVVATPAKPPIAVATAIQNDSTFSDLPLTNMRQTIAKRLSASKSSIPHFYSTGEAVIDPILRMRSLLKVAGVSVSVNDFVVSACAMALRLVPEVNSRLGSDGNVVFNNTVDISVAVASDSGLITPIVFGADTLSLETIGSTIRALADKARQNKLQPAEFMGGTFTISNLGMFGIKEFTAIINSPQCAILAVGSGTPTAALDPVNPDRPKIETRMRFTLSADARLVDQATAARFLGHVKTYLEHPDLLSSSETGLSQAWGY